MWYRFSQAQNTGLDFTNAIDAILTNPALDNQQKAEQLFTLTKAPGMNPSFVLNRLGAMPGGASEEIQNFFTQKIYAPNESLTESNTVPPVINAILPGNGNNNLGNLTAPQGNTGTLTPQSPTGNQADAAMPKLEQKYFKFYTPGSPETDSNYRGSTPVGGWAGYLGPNDGVNYNQGYEPIYQLGTDGKPLLRPDGQPIVKGFKYDGNKNTQNPQQSFNTSSMDAALKESGVQFIIGGGSANNPISPDNKTAIINKLNTNKLPNTNLFDPSKLNELNTYLKTIGYSATIDQPTGVLEVVKGAV